MFRSATFKLTVWYVAIVMAISIAFSIVLYHGATGELNRGFRRESARISEQFPVFQGNPALRPGPDSSVASHRLLGQLVGFNLIVFISAGFVSYWLARRTLEPIEEAHQQQKRFTADVSHELRTPLTALRMESEVALLNKKADAPSLRKTLASNLEEVSKLEVLINNLLRLGRLEADELQQNFTAFNSQNALQAAITQVQPLADEHRIKLESNGQGKTLNGDYDGIVQLLVILLDNAIKYSPAKSTITATIENKGSRALYIIEDTGQGISPEALDHVFDRFYRASKSRTQGRDAGHGLGLSIAKMIADVHQGTIMLSSRVGHGTTATLSLPATESEMTETDRSPSPAPRPPR